MNVFVVLEVIDLGDHIVSIHYNDDSAISVAESKNAEYMTLYGKSGKKEWFYVSKHTIQN